MLFNMGWVMTGLLLGGVLAAAALLLSPKLKEEFETSSPFECGFDPKGSGRIPFSLRFYLIGVIFLVFDVEITYLLPMIPSWSSHSVTVTLGGLLFVLILFIGTIYEWFEGALNWEDYKL